MDATKGAWKESHRTILQGDHHIITTGILNSGLEDVKEGTLLKEDSPGSGEYAPAAPGDAADLIAVLNDTVDDSDKTDAVAVVVHGVVRRKKLLYSDDTPIDAAGVAALRLYGIYAV
jgi:hypothetical protein